MLLISHPIHRSDLKEMARKSFGNLVKAVVDTSRKVIVVDASLHADEEAMLLSQGSLQSDIWGINLYPDLHGDDFIEFDSMINVRPGHNNTTRGVDNPTIRKKIVNIVSELVR